MMVYVSITCLLTETGDAGSSPHVARWVVSMMFQLSWPNFAIHIISADSDTTKKAHADKIGENLH